MPATSMRQHQFAHENERIFHSGEAACETQETWSLLPTGAAGSADSAAANIISGDHQLMLSVLLAAGGAAYGIALLRLLLIVAAGLVLLPVLLSLHLGKARHPAADGRPLLRPSNQPEAWT